MTKDNKKSSNTIGLAEHAYKISQELQKAYENPTLSTIKRLQEDQQSLLSSSISQWNTPSIQQKIQEYEKLLKEPGLAAAFATQQDYEKYTKPLLSLLESHEYQTAQKNLQDLKPRIKPEYYAIESAIEQLQKTLDTPSINSTLQHIPKLSQYESSISKAIESISKNEALLTSSKQLFNAGKGLAHDSIQQRMNEHQVENARIMHIELPDIKIPENPLINLNRQIVEIGNIQNEMLKDISDQMRLQNEYTDKEIQALEYQNEIAKEQISDNKKSSRNAVRVAIASVIMSIVVSGISIWATYDIYNKEKKENDDDTHKLLKAINDKTEQKQLLQEFTDFKHLNTSQEDKQTKIIQLLVEQNVYLKAIAQQKDTNETHK